MEAARFSVAALILWSAMACAQDVPVRRTGSDFDAAVNFASPLLTQRVDADDNLMVNLQARRDNATGAIVWRLVLQAVYTDTAWRDYTGVSLLGGRTLPGDGGPREVLGCEYARCQFGEVLVVPLPDDVRAAAERDGLRVRWNAERRGAFFSDVPASHFAAVRAALASP